MRVAVLTAVLCLGAVGLSMAADSEASIRKPTNIPAQGLGPALKELARDRGIQLVFRSEVVGSAQTRGAHGDLTTTEAFSRLLEGTNLVFSYLDAKTVTVMMRTDVSPEAAIDGQEIVSPAGTTGTQMNQEGTKSGGESLLVAQLDQTSTGPQVTSTESSEKKKTEEPLAEIVVTGTHIRGDSTALSPVMTFDRQTIEQSGYLDTQSFIQSIPQAFGGGAQGASPDGMLGGGSGAPGNYEHASAVNLRGLGENATLVLLNGQRMAPSSFGNVVDISTIPLSAIDHVDVLTDGASAIYGADAVAGVVNIVLRRNFDGAETQATYGGASGGLRQDLFTQMVGKTWSTGSIMASYQYDHGSTLPTTARSFTSGAPQPTNIINPFTENSLVINGDQRIIDNLTLSGDALATWKRTESDIAYGTTDVVRDFSNPSAINLHLGLDYAINDRWNLDLNGAYARQRTDIGFNSYNGAIVPGQYVIFVTAPLSNYELNLSGRPLTLPGGDVGVAMGFSHRNESAEADYSAIGRTFLGGPPVTSVGRHVNAEYAELRLPFVGPENNIPLVNKLVASAAIRHDDYSDFGGTTNPKLGLLWSPTSFLDVKANWSRAFRAPSVGEDLLNVGFGTDEVFVAPPYFTNPSGPGEVQVLSVGGENPHLNPETAITYDVGLALHIASIPGLKLSIDYYNVSFKNRIELPPTAQDELLFPNIYGSLIKQFPNDAATAAYVAGLEAQGYQLTDIGFGTSLTGIRYAILNYFLNAAVVNQNGIDLLGQYAFSLGAESFQTTVNAAFINKIDTQLAPGTSSINLVNTYSNPLRLRLRWDGSWTHGPVVVAAAVNFSNRYSDPSTNPSSPIASFTTFDLTGTVRLAPNTPSSFFHGTSLRFAANNLFDRLPPFAQGTAVLSGVYYDVGNASPVGRLLSIQLIKRW